MTCPLPLTFRCTPDLVPKFLNPQISKHKNNAIGNTDGQENGVEFDPSRPVSGFNDLLELRKMIIFLHLPC